MSAPKVAFANNVPVELSLKYAAGKLVSGRYGDQYYYSLSYSSDGAPGIYLDPDPAGKIDRLRIKPNEKFWICKRKGSGKGAMVTWDVWRGPEKGVMEGRIERDSSPTPLQRDMARSIDRLNDGRGFGYGSVHGELTVPTGQLVTLEDLGKIPGADSPTLPAPSNEQPRREPSAIHQDSSQSIPRREPRTQLEDALCTAIAACHAAQEYARSIGFGLTFTAEDIRCCANTILIGQQRNGRAA